MYSTGCGKCRVGLECVSRLAGILLKLARLLIGRPHSHTAEACANAGHMCGLSDSTQQRVVIGWRSVEQILFAQQRRLCLGQILGVCSRVCAEASTGERMRAQRSSVVDPALVKLSALHTQGWLRHHRRRRLTRLFRGT